MYVHIKPVFDTSALEISFQWHPLSYKTVICLPDKASFRVITSETADGVSEFVFKSLCNNCFV